MSKEDYTRSPVVAKLFDPLFLIYPTGLYYLGQWSYLFCYYGTFGLSIKDLNYSLTDYLFGSLWPVLVILYTLSMPLCFFNIKAVLNAVEKVSILLVFLTVLIIACCIFIAQAMAEDALQHPKNLRARFTAYDGKSICDFYLLIKNDGAYYFYRPHKMIEEKIRPISLISK